MPPINSPHETVTFLFTDIEGSTALWQQHAAALRAALPRHEQILGEAVSGADGRLFKRVGDALCAAFPTAGAALAAALAGQQALLAAPGQDYPRCGCAWRCIPAAPSGAMAIIMAPA